MTEKRNIYCGMMPILPTAINPQGEIDEQSQRRLVQYCLQCGAVAIGHFGIASEFHKISDSQRRQLTRLIIDEAGGRVPVFIGVTAQGFEIALNYAKEAEQLGADMIMAALPALNPPSAAEAFQFFSALADTVSLPIIIQDTPESANILSPELVFSMFKEIETVKFIKAEGSNFIPKIAEIMRLSAREFEVIGGAGGRYLIHLLRLGVTSFMTGTEALDLHNATVQAYLCGAKEKAAELYFQKILPYFMFYENYSEQLLKAMLHKRGIIEHANVISPAAKAPMSQIEWQEFNWILQRIGFDEKWPVY